MDVITYSNDPNRYSLASLTIRSAAWTRLAPFAVGESVDEIRAEARRRREGRLAAAVDLRRESESVHFETTRAGRVSAIIYECYTG
jgi:hypothetical protein